VLIFAVIVQFLAGIARIVLGDKWVELSQGKHTKNVLLQELVV
jgi:hypothetical protein